MDCAVCLEKKSKIIRCPYCTDFHVCFDCTATYLSSRVDRSHCMNCKTYWSDADLEKLFTKKWIQTVHTPKVKRLLLEREKSLLQPILEERLANKLRKEEQKKEMEELVIQMKPQIETIQKEARSLEQEMNKLKMERCRIYSNVAKRMKEQKIEIKTLDGGKKNYELITEEEEKRIDDIGGHLYLLKLEKEKLYNRLRITRPMRNFAKINILKMSYEEIAQRLQAAPYTISRGLYYGRLEVEKPVFKLKSFCPSNGCKGMIDEKGICCICEKKVCLGCNEPYSANHSCDPEVKASFRSIKRECRNCPKCSAPIFKIDGCDQMFCPVEGCLTVFDWSTLQLSRGNIHNPLAIRYLREHGNLKRELADVPCGGLIPLTQRPYLKLIPLDVIDVYRFTADLRHYITWNTAERELKKWRIEYLDQGLSEVLWSNRIYRHTKKEEQKQTLKDALQTFEHILIERFRNYGEAVEEIIARKPQYEVAFEIITFSWDFMAEAVKIRDLLSEALIEIVPNVEIRPTIVQWQLQNMKILTK